MAERVRKSNSSNLITDWETNDRMSNYQREKSRTIEEDFLRRKFNKQDYDLEPNKQSQEKKKTFLYKGSVYIIINETDMEITGKRGNETITIKKEGSKS